MSSDYTDMVGEMRSIQDRARAIRTRYCDHTSRAKPRYIGLSKAVSNLTRSTENMKGEGA